MWQSQNHKPPPRSPVCWVSQASPNGSCWWQPECFTLNHYYIIIILIIIHHYYIITIRTLLINHYPTMCSCFFSFLVAPKPYSSYGLILKITINIATCSYDFSFYIPYGLVPYFPTHISIHFAENPIKSRKISSKPTKSPSKSHWVSHSYGIITINLHESG